MAVKVLHVSASALVDAEAAAAATIPPAGTGGSRAGAEKQRAKGPAGAGAPQTGIMEAVLSSTMCHPNVVQVYTYTMEPLGSMGGATLQLGSEEGGEEIYGTSREGQQQQGLGMVWAKGAAPRSRHVTGWELRIIMEYCTGVSRGGALGSIWVGYCMTGVLGSGWLLCIFCSWCYPEQTLFLFLLSSCKNVRGMSWFASRVVGKLKLLLYRINHLQFGPPQQDAYKETPLQLKVNGLTQAEEFFCC